MNITVTDLHKSYGSAHAVDGLDFTVEPGKVTGFLGPNGAGKSTTMRVIVGLDRPDRGMATIGGRRYVDLDRPLCHVGALLEARAAHPGRRARDHLGYLAHTQGIALRRVDEVLELVGLAGVADKRVKGFSLGMGQRLGIAVALLGDPEVLILDEPVNGLDVDGVRWVRRLLRDLADEGRTVLLSSHLLGEMSLTADHLVVIQNGRLVADCSTSQFLDRSSHQSVRVGSPDVDCMLEPLGAAGGTVQRLAADSVSVTGLDAKTIGVIAADHGCVLFELTTSRPTLEDTFVALTTGSDADEAMAVAQ